ncbi:unnamed protein product [Allacma fusca]|uniref:Uncharacterized protein n=1 Tax=Allacma fusca TaxID=39272 RepID=A0A8J2LIK1_9HEXA|nr:unnamed protein product [Allacma fusca]
MTTTAVREDEFLFEIESTISSKSDSESSLDSAFEPDKGSLKNAKGFGRKNNVSGNQPTLMVCNTCSRTFRHDFMSEHFQEFHPQVNCSFCDQAVDRFELRKHQERYCPERASICPHCYVQLPNSLLTDHLATCLPKYRNVRKPKVLPNKELSFKGTVFEDHARIANSYINLARGHSVDKPLSQMIVKAEMKMNDDEALAKYMNELVDAFCSSTSGTSLKKEGADTKSKNLPRQIVTPLKVAIGKNDDLRKSKSEKVKLLSGAIACFSTPNLNPLKPPKPPAKARCIRKIHQSISNGFRDDCNRRKFIRSWLKHLYVSKAELREDKIKEEEMVEDAVIDEAIQLELQKEMLDRIPRNKWPYFVEEIKLRRRKWKDLGFGLEERKVFEEFTDCSELDTSFLPNRKLLGSPSNITKRKESFSGGFYKTCEFCAQLFHEDELHEHSIACKAQKERAAQRKYQAKRKTTSNATLKPNGKSFFELPRPIPQQNVSSLALSIAAHDKKYRSGENNYSFLVKTGRV